MTGCQLFVLGSVFLIYSLLSILSFLVDPKWCKVSPQETMKRLCVSFSMFVRLLKVACTYGPTAAVSWIHNARRMKEDASIIVEKHSVIRNEQPVVPKELAAEIDTMFRKRAEAGKKDAFSQSSQTSVFLHDLPKDLLPPLEQLYRQVLDTINTKTSLVLFPIKENFCERIYAIDYAGPKIELPFHYDCNDASDWKCQILLEKSEGAPSLWVTDAAGKKTPLPEDIRNVCLFHPHSCFHGIPRGKGKGHRRVLLMTFTQLQNDHRPIVCHADLNSKQDYKHDAWGGMQILQRAWKTLK